MGTYTSRAQPLPNGLDEIGLDLSLPRLEDEALATYRKRILLETRLPGGATQDEFAVSASRQVGLFDEPLIEIDLVLDANGDPVGADPHFEVTSTRVRAYHDYSLGDAGLDFTLVIERAQNWFVDDLVTALTASAYFSVNIENADYQYKLLRDLQFGSSLKTVDRRLLRKSYENALGFRYVRSFLPQSVAAFINEKATQALVVADGDYFVDYTNGVVFTYTLQSGGAMLTHRDFPYLLREAGVRVVPVNDADLIYRTHELVYSDVGVLDESNHLGSFGGWLTNQIYDVAPMGWGK